MRRIFQLAIRVPYEWWLAKFHAEKFVARVGVVFGRGCRFLSVSRSTFGTEPYLIKLGDHVTITGGVRFITHDGGVWIFRHELPEIDVFGPIVIGNNVFVGLNAIIMPGATVGDDVVIGAGSVVTGSLTSGGVYAGVPARRIMSSEAYKEKVLRKADFVRSIGAANKKKYLLNRYFNG